MIVVQIKAKSGLHAGATWRLTNSHIMVGGSGRAEVFLCDPGIPDSLISLIRIGHRYDIRQINPECRLTSSDQKPIDNQFYAPQTITLDFRHIQLEFQISIANSGFVTSIQDRWYRSTYAVLQMLRGLGAKAIAGFVFLVSMLLTILVLFFGAAGFVKSEASVMKGEALSQAQKKPTAPTLDQRMIENIINDLDDFGQRESLTGMRIQHTDRSVSVESTMSRAQLRKLESVLSRQARDYGENIDFQVKVNLTEQQKIIDQLDIEQVVLGEQPVVVLRTGDRLYLGADYKGLNLVDISANRVVFKGDAVYEVAL